MGKIKILLIDDNPFCGLENLDETDFAFLAKFFNRTTKEVETITILDLGFPVFNNLEGKETKYNSFLDYFDLKWLHSTSSIKEYYDAINRLDNDALLNNKSIFIPDIIVFDYAMTGSEIEANTKPKGYRIDFIEEKLDPVINLRNLLDLNKSENYSWGKVDNEDRFGLFSGGMIIERFRRNKPCFGVPSTYWTKDKLKATEAGFFEWFLSDSFRNIFDENELRGKTEKNKSWQVIIDSALIELRKEIIENIKLDKIILNYNNLIDIAGTNNNDIEKKTLKYKSIYGQREIPIQGLFIDCSIGKVTEELNEEFSKFDFVDPTIRQVEIFKFISEILDIVTLNLSLAEIKEAEAAAKQLLTVFDGPIFTQRIMLSELHRKHINKEKLDKEDKRTYKELLKIFTISDNKITNVTPFTISELGSKGINKNIPFNKLIVSFAAINLLKRWDTFMDNIIKEDSLYNDYNNQPTESMVQPDINDLLLLLFPIWTEHIILFNDKGSIKKNVKDTFQRQLLTLVKAKFKDLKSEVNGIIDLSNFLSKGELYLVSIYAESLNFRIPNTLKWIKNGNK